MSLMLSGLLCVRMAGYAFSHPQGTHDDVFWACGLAVFSTVEMSAFDPEAAHFG